MAFLKKVRSQKNMPKCDVCRETAEYYAGDNESPICAACLNDPARVLRIRSEREQERKIFHAESLRWEVEYTRKSFDKKVQEIVNDLTRKAEEITREAARLDDANYPSDAFEVAERIQHTVLWALANLGLDHLVREAKGLESAKARFAAVPPEDVAALEEYTAKQEERRAAAKARTYDGDMEALAKSVVDDIRPALDMLAAHDTAPEN